MTQIVPTSSPLDELKEIAQFGAKNAVEQTFLLKTVGGKKALAEALEIRLEAFLKEQNLIKAIQVYLYAVEQEEQTKEQQQAVDQYVVTHVIKEHHANKKDKHEAIHKLVNELLNLEKSVEQEKDIFSKLSSLGSLQDIIKTGVAETRKTTSLETALTALRLTPEFSCASKKEEKEKLIDFYIRKSLDDRRLAIQQNQKIAQERYQISCQRTEAALMAYREVKELQHGHSHKKQLDQLESRYLNQVEIHKKYANSYSKMENDLAQMLANFDILINKLNRNNASAKTSPIYISLFNAYNPVISQQYENFNPSPIQAQNKTHALFRPQSPKNRVEVLEETGSQLNVSHPGKKPRCVPKGHVS